MAKFIENNFNNLSKEDFWKLVETNCIKNKEAFISTIQEWSGCDISDPDDLEDYPDTIYDVYAFMSGIIWNILNMTKEDAIELGENEGLCIGVYMYEYYDNNDYEQSALNIINEIQK